MNASHTALENVLCAATTIIDRTPALTEFAAVPTDLDFVQRAPVSKPAVDCLVSGLPAASPATQPLVDAVVSTAPYAEWRTTYTAEQVGVDFVNRYGYFELYGPSGHYTSQQSRAFIGYWGDHLHYPRHQHEAEEVYYIIAGEAYFDTGNEPTRCCSVEDMQFHYANQSHSMTTKNSAVLCLALWRGAGFETSAHLSPY